jgi:radical SAM superfamily enzyme YgiQ (UPF0313 family)
MTWIALVGPEIEENLSLRYIASSLAQAGLDCEIIAFNHDGDFAPGLRAILDAQEPPLLVGLSLAFQWRAQDFIAFGLALRDGGYTGHITAGGHFGTFACREILADFPEIDSVIRQEAEETTVRLCQGLRDGTSLAAIAGLALRGEHGDVFLTPHPSLPDLATLPWPDRRGEPAACFAHAIAPLVSSRGCYANCTFCCIAAWQEQSLPGKRYRLREVEAVADEMVALQKTRGIEIFVFHDDNFFVPGHRRNLERFNALADALQARKIGKFATVVKARPTDVEPEVFEVLRRRLQCIRVYVGVETDADQGLRTLRRWAKASQNHSAIEIVRKLELYTCFNMLIFDPDTTLDSIATNVAFMRYAADYPSNFGRVELYAGTPLLERMQREGRCTGDWMQWDYQLSSAEVQRVFSLSMACFYPRNFGPDALNNCIMGTRFDIEVCKHFHPDAFDAAWLEQGKRLTRELTWDSCDALDAIVDHVRSGTPDSRDAALVVELSRQLRATESVIRERARDLAATLQGVVKQGRPLTEIGDRVATPLQTSRHTLGAFG